MWRRGLESSSESLAGWTRPPGSLPEHFFICISDEPECSRLHSVKISESLRFLQINLTCIEGLTQGNIDQDEKKFNYSGQGCGSSSILCGYGSRAWFFHSHAKVIVLKWFKKKKKIFGILILDQDQGTLNIWIQISNPNLSIFAMISICVVA